MFFQQIACVCRAGPQGSVTVTVEEGADMTDPACGFAAAGGPGRHKCSEVGIATAAALAAADTTDVVVLALGNSEWQNGFTCHENKDRESSIGLPGQQLEVVSAVMNATRGKPIVTVLVNGGLASLDTLTAVPISAAQQLAIVEALLPGNTGASALAAALFGKTNTFGKLPFTMVPSSFVDESDFSDLSMSNPPGRSYKYYTGKALYDFSAGLSYTTFALLPSSPAALAVGGVAAEWPRVSVTVKNTGVLAGDEVVFLFHNASVAHSAWLAGQIGSGVAPPPLPMKQLVDFERVSLQPGQATVVTFQLTPNSIATVDAAGSRRVLPGGHSLVVSRGASHTADEVRTELQVQALMPLVLSQLPA